jgi:MFS transporter, PAT family, beta-lactamase induction signal transducer AmpG
VNQAPSLSQSVFNRRILACALLGFASGLPYYALVQLLPTWLKEQGFALSTLGHLSTVRTPYVWKFLWAPLVDRFSLPGLGRFRGWMVLTQVALWLSISGFALLDEPPSLTYVVALGFAIAAFGATQDIALDAYRRELLPDEELALGNSVWVNTYRLAGFVPGSVALLVAATFSWRAAHLVVAACMLASIGATFVAPRLPPQPSSPRRLWDAVRGPFIEFFTRGDLRDAFKLLGFLFLYKLGDNLATALLSPFYLDVGFSLKQIAAVVKPVSVASMLIGSMLGGLWIVRLGIHRALWLFGVVQLVSILGFAALAEIGADVRALVLAVTFEYLGIGLGTAAFVAFISRATSRTFSATQYALFSSFVSLPGILVGAVAGHLIEALGYTTFFLLCTALSLPGMALLPFVAPWREKPIAPPR